MPIPVHRAGFGRCAWRRCMARDHFRLGSRLDLGDFFRANNDQIAGLRVIHHIRRCRQACEQQPGDVGYQVDFAEGAAGLIVHAEIISAAIAFDGDMAERFVVARKGTADGRQFRWSGLCRRVLPCLQIDTQRRATVGFG